MRPKMIPCVVGFGDRRVMLARFRQFVDKFDHFIEAQAFACWLLEAANQRARTFARQAELSDKDVVISCVAGEHMK